jgi:hypothetical protein
MKKMHTHKRTKEQKSEKYEKNKKKRKKYTNEMKRKKYTNEKKSEPECFRAVTVYIDFNLDAMNVQNSSLKN